MICLAGSLIICSQSFQQRCHGCGSHNDNPFHGRGGTSKKLAAAAAILAEQTNAVKWAFHVSNIFFAS